VIIYDETDMTEHSDFTSVGITADAGLNEHRERGPASLHEQSVSKDSLQENFSEQASNNYDVLAAVGSPANAAKSIRKKQTAISNSMAKIALEKKQQNLLAAGSDEDRRVEVARKGGKYSFESEGKIFIPELLVLMCSDSLRTLIASKNPLYHSKLPGILEQFTNLTVLRVCDCGLVELGDELRGLGKLGFLYASDNPIQSISPMISHLTALRHLELLNTTLSYFPCELSRTPLETLEFSGTAEHIFPPESVLQKGLKSIMSMLKGLYRCQKTGNLNWTNTGMATIPRLLDKDLPTVRSLSLDSNPIADLEGLELYSNLTSISFKKTKVKHFPFSLRDLALIDIKCDTDQMIDPPESIMQLSADVVRSYLISTSDCVTSSKLDFKGFGLLEYPHHEDFLKSITVSQLDISDNLISSMPFSFGFFFDSITHFNGDNNKFCLFPAALEALTTLHLLTLNHCEIEFVPDWISKIKSLKEFSLDDNRLKTLPHQMASLVNIIKFSCRRNLLQSPLSVIVNAEWQYLREFLTRIKTWALTYAFDLSGCQADRISTEYRDLIKSMTSINFSGNLMKELTEGLEFASCIQQMNVSHNLLTSLDTLNGIMWNISTLVSLNCSHNFMTTMQECVINSKGLEEINFSYCKVRYGFTIRQRYSTLVHLRILDISGNGLEDFPESLCHFPSLTDLKATHNHLESLPEQLCCLTSIKMLNFEDNRIEWLPSALDNFKDLKSLNLLNNPIREIPDRLGSCEQLLPSGILVNIDEGTTVEHPPPDITKHGMHYVHLFMKSQWRAMTEGFLDLEDKQLNVVPPIHWQDFGRLSTLNLSKNNLTKLPVKIGSLSSLTKLDLSHNKFEALSQFLLHLRNLTLLDLSHNHIAEVPFVIGKLLSMKTFCLNNNRLRLLSRSTMGNQLSLATIVGGAESATGWKRPPVTCGNTFGASLWNFHRHQFRALGTVKYQIKKAEGRVGGILNLINLEELYIQNNGIVVLPSYIGNLRRLRVLVAHHNKLTFFPEVLGDLTQLTIVDMSFNQISNMPKEIGKCSLLEEVHIQNNMVQSLPSELGYCQNMRILNASFNCCENIPPEFSLFQGRIEIFSLAQNPIFDPPQDVLQHGAARMFLYLRRMFYAKKSRDLHFAHMQLTVFTLSPIRIIELEHLDLSFNTFTFLPDGMSIMTRLHHLNVSANRFESLPTFIVGCCNLKYLAANSNIIRSITHELSGCKSSLTELSLDLNRINDMDRSLAEMVALEKVSVSRNRLGELHKDSLRFKTVKKVVLSFNFLHQFPVGVILCGNLFEIDISNNRISEVPDTISRLNVLRLFNISNNTLEALTPYIAFLLNLQLLDLSHNLISILPSPVSCLSCLTCLRLNHNALASLPIGLAAITTLKIISLNGNAGLVVPSFMQLMSNLEELSISRSQMGMFGSKLSAIVMQRSEVGIIPLKKAPIHTYRAKSKSWDDMMQNDDTSVELCGLRAAFIARNVGMEQALLFVNSVSLDSNSEDFDVCAIELDSIPYEIVQFKYLTNLNISHNNIAEVPSVLGNLFYMEHVYFQNNRLEMLPQSLSNWKSLVSCDISSNNMRSLPSAVNFWIILEELDASDNIMSTILVDSHDGRTRASEFLISSTLQKLSISGNLLQSSIMIHALCTSLRVLHCNSNILLRQMPFTNKYDSNHRSLNITEISLRGCVLAELPSFIRRFPFLEVIDLSFNMIEMMQESGIRSMHVLLSLDLKGNLLRTVPECISALSSLTKLDISNNLLSTLPEAISNMVTLITVDAKQNVLNYIPNCIGVLHKTVTSFDIRENAETLIHPPDYLANKGAHKLATFQLHNCTHNLNCLQVVSILPGARRSRTWRNKCISSENRSS
jgi:Leucine-rich repeat (LRR) protein